jgi:hypothetical protein
MPGAFYHVGFLLEADTSGNNKSIEIFDADANNSHNFSGGPAVNTVNHNGQTQIEYAFATPFVAHLIREQPQDQVSWRKWGLIPKGEPWPELTSESSLWMNLGTVGAKYLLNVVIPMDTNGAPVSLTFLSSDGGSVTLGPFTTTAAEKTAIAWAFTIPLIGHEFQIIPSAPIRIWYEEIKWAFDAWPELIDGASGWMNLGTVGAKYLLTAVVPMDTNGQPVTLTLLSSDGGSVTMGPFTTTAEEKTDQAWAFTIPLVGHEFQIIPSVPVRIWYDQIKWSFDPWPELVDGATGWLKPRGGLAAWLQGFVVPVEASGAIPNMKLLYDNGQSVALTSPVTPVANQKTPIPYSLVNPAVCHIAQLVPSEPCRIWTEEIIWISEATPELAATWKTQATSHGVKGYHSIYRLEWAYAATAPCTLVIASTDGSSPVSISLPATGGNKTRVLITPTFNKGQLFQYSQTSNNTHQVFGGECVAWIGTWGRKGPCIPWRGLGGDFTDDARI